MSAFVYTSKPLLILTVLLLLGTAPVYAADPTPPNNEADDNQQQFLTLGAHKISNYCIQALRDFQIENPRTSLSLEECENVQLLPSGWACEKIFYVCPPNHKKNKQCLEKLENPYADCRATTSTSISCLRPTNECSTEDNAGYFQTAFIGKVGDIFFVSTSWSGGGSGSFSELFGVFFETQNGKTVLSKFLSLELGDKANGGLIDASVDGKSVHFSTAMTYGDFLSAAGLNMSYKNSPWGDIVSNHNAGVYVTQLQHITPPSKTVIFDAISAFDIDEGNSSYWNTDYKPATAPQICLQSIMLEEEKKHNKSGYTPDQLKALGDHIQKTCLAH